MNEFEDIIKETKRIAEKIINASENNKGVRLTEREIHILRLTIFSCDVYGEEEDD